MKTMTRRIPLAVLIVVAVLIIFGRDQLRYRTLAWLVLHQTTPGENSMRETVDAAPNRVDALKKLWNCGHLCQREFAINYLRDKTRTASISEFWPSMRSLTIEAAFCGDYEIQQAGITILEDRADPDLVPIAMTLLDDVDPRVRSLGASTVFRTGDKKFIPIFVRLLDDPDHAVRVDAAGSLNTLNDGNMRTAYDLDDPKSGQIAVDYWKKWWPAHKNEYVSSVMPPLAAVSTSTMGVAPDFTLPDLQGNRVSIKDFRGKPVLLIFWATWCKPCLMELPDIAAFQKKHSDEVTVLGISLDNLVDAETGKAHVEGTDAELADRVVQFAKDRQIAYRILLDNKGDALGPYSGGDLPVAVWVDGNGIMRRRFLGSRNSDCLERMLQAMLLPLDAKRS